MPELAEVEFFRKQWDPGIGSSVVEALLHKSKRVFRETDPARLEKELEGKILARSEARGKRLLFQFSGGCWLGLHLGMTGQLSNAGPDFIPGRHDHLVLRLKKRALIFSDPRVFGSVRFHRGRAAPRWWAELPPPISSPAFSAERVERFLKRHRRLPVKSALLLQDGFPGIGNWMADEILWRARLDPRTPAGRLEPDSTRKLWRITRQICRVALNRIGARHSDVPKTWLFHQRWEKSGACPVHRLPLARERIGGRTTAWCPLCQFRVMIKPAI